MFTRKIFRTIHYLDKLKQVRYKSTVMTDEKFAIPKRFVGSDYSVWVEYVQLAAEYNPVNLGQGFPNYPPPLHVTNSLRDIGSPENFMLNQYTRGYGHPNLVKALSQFYSQLIGRQINQNTEILVTIGAYEALYCSIQGHVEMGDEVIIMEPFYDCYEPMVKTAGGVCKFIPLRPTKTEGTILSSDWKLDVAELEALFSAKTKIIILNTPHNPIGKVFDREELTLIADLCKKWNVLCISDEVYEWIVYPPNEHIRIATLPDMWERTITIGSAGKTFSVTGWKTGWAYGPANLLRNLQVIHQNCVYTCCTPIQEATARGFGVEMSLFGTDKSYFKTLPLELEAKRDFMAKFLKDIGMNPTIPQGGYFMIADWSKLADKVDLSKELDEYKDYKFTKWMTKSVGLQGIPPTAFYSKNKCLAEDLVRYCFFKTDETLQEACQILGKWKESW